jgi:hypothetical protein
VLTYARHVSIRDVGLVQVLAEIAQTRSRQEEDV